MPIKARLSDKKQTSYNGEAQAKSAALVAGTFLSGPKPTQGRATSNRTAKGAITTKTEGKKLATRKSTPTDEELGFLDDIEVRRADGSVDTLADLEHPLDRKAAPKNGASPKKPAAKAAPRGAGKAAVDASVKARAAAQKIKDKAITDAAAIREKAKKEAATLKEKNKLAAQKARDDKAAKAKADREAAAQKKKDEREAKAAERAVQREADKAEREAKKNRARGETGDPVLDAAFHKAVDESRALSIAPKDIKDIKVFSLGFLKIPGLELSAVGLDLPESLSIGDWTNTLRGLRGVQDVSQFAFGDALNFGEKKYGSQYTVVMEVLDIENSTAKNYKYVAKLFGKDERVPGVPFGHHLEVAGIFAQNPALARNLLDQAARERWTQKQLRAKVVEAKGGPTPAQAKAAQVEALVMLSNEQYEEDLALYKTPAEVRKHNKADLDALLEYANTNDVVPAPAAVRSLARLTYALEEAQGEAQLWKDRALAAEAKLASFGEAQARVASDATEGTATAAPEVEVEDVDLDATESEG